MSSRGLMWCIRGTIMEDSKVCVVVCGYKSVQNKNLKEFVES